MGWPELAFIAAGLGVLLTAGIGVVLVVVVVKMVADASSRPRGSEALRTLDERYARGEITRDEYLERRAVLTDGGSAGVRRTSQTR